MNSSGTTITPSADLTQAANAPAVAPYDTVGEAGFRLLLSMVPADRREAALAALRADIAASAPATSLAQ